MPDAQKAQEPRNIHAVRIRKIASTVNSEGDYCMDSACGKMASKIDENPSNNSQRSTKFDTGSQEEGVLSLVWGRSTPTRPMDNQSLPS